MTRSWSPPRSPTLSPPAPGSSPSSRRSSATASRPRPPRRPPARSRRPYAEGGAVPATIAVYGRVRVGLDDDALVRVAEDDEVVKASTRDLGMVVARGLVGATTVAATSYIAHLAGIRLFATGGLGGVHRGAVQSSDESADLAALAATPVTVVCAGEVHPRRAGDPRAAGDPLRRRGRLRHRHLPGLLHP